ncbi:MAG: hypothetical protein M5U01_03960 [Ardenticatenaceae bacterium]|nr:hypothetical protein [Ardenticatenaceae bacterium]HBY92469.1 hypothetical protein [Chloroflexota bacterium]
MSAGLLLDAVCLTCNYEVHNLSLGATATFAAGDPSGWLAVVTACPSCQALVDVVLTRSDLEREDQRPEFRCPHCEALLSPPNQTYPDLTLTQVAASERGEIRPQVCPRCLNPTLIVRIVGTFD